MNYYPHHISDFNNATRHLTRVERSVYRDAIERYYDTESPLSTDFEYLARRLLCFSDEEKKALQSILSDFFQLTDAGYTHERCDLEIERYQANTSAKAKAGRASAEARKRKAAERKEKRTSVKQNLTSVANQEPITNNQEPIKKEKRFSPPSLEEVQEYCLQRKNQIDPEAFIAFYTSKNWMVGKTKMKDWKSCVITWEKRQKPTSRSTESSLRNRSMIDDLTDTSWAS